MEPEEVLAQTEALMTAGRPREAVEILEEVLAGIEGGAASASEAALALYYGRLGEGRFHSGDVEGAIVPTEAALSLCLDAKTPSGITAYLGSLYEIHRYRGASEIAARVLDGLATLLESSGDLRRAAAQRRQREVVLRGEPACRVVAAFEDESFEVDEVPPALERIRFVFARNRVSLKPCTVAVAEGGKAIEAGDLEAALAFFRRGALADTFDPWPTYHEGATLVHLRRYDEAAAAFRATEARAPGWHDTRSELWVAEQLTAGSMSHETFYALGELQQGGLSPARAVEKARALHDEKPLALASLPLGHALTKLGRAAEAEAAFRRGLELAGESDIKTRLATALACAVADRDEKVSLLRAAAELRGNLVAAAMAEVMLRTRELGG